MPDVVLKDKFIGKDKKYYVCLEEQIRYNAYVYYVSMCPKKSEHFYGYPIYSNTYSNRKSAENAFYRYCRKAKDRIKEAV